MPTTSPKELCPGVFSREKTENCVAKEPAYFLQESMDP
jgi:hypothetical protein